MMLPAYAEWPDEVRAEVKVAALEQLEWKLYRVEKLLRDATGREVKNLLDRKQHLLNAHDAAMRLP